MGTQRIIQPCQWFCLDAVEAQLRRSGGGLVREVWGGVFAVFFTMKLGMSMSSTTVYRHLLILSSNGKCAITSLSLRSGRDKCGILAPVEVLCQTKNLQKVVALVVSPWDAELEVSVPSSNTSQMSSEEKKGTVLWWMVWMAPLCNGGMPNKGLQEQHFHERKML